MANAFVEKATGTTSASIPAHQKGDLIVAFCFRDGSNTPPTVPTGRNWSIAKRDTGANTCSAMVVYKFARHSAETTGTFTSASSTIVHVYRGAKNIGGVAETGASGTTITYPTVSMSVSDGTSWVAGFAGHRAVDTSLQTAPEGMVNRSTVVDTTDECAGHDTNGGVSSWSKTDVSVGGSSTGWRAITVEIIAAPATLTERVRYVNTASAGGDGTTNNTSGATAAYASLYACLDAEEEVAIGNLVAQNEYLTIKCEGSTADSTPVVFASNWGIMGFTTDSTHYIKIIGNSTTNGRHAGVWSTSKYRLSTSAGDGSDRGAIYIADVSLDLRIEGIQIETSFTAIENNQCGNVIRAFYFKTGSLYLDGLICKHSGTLGAYTSDEWRNVYWQPEESTGPYLLVMRNCVLYGNHQTAVRVGMGNSVANASAYLYNNTIISGAGDNGAGVEFDGYQSSGCVQVFKNNLIQGNNNDFVAGEEEITITHSNNITQDASSPDASYRSKTVSFAAAGDYHLNSSDTVAKDQGADLSGVTYGFTVNIDNETRSGTWDIGADELASTGFTATVAQQIKAASQSLSAAETFSATVAQTQKAVTGAISALETFTAAVEQTVKAAQQALESNLAYTATVEQSPKAAEQSLEAALAYAATVAQASLAAEQALSGAVSLTATIAQTGPASEQSITAIYGYAATIAHAAQAAQQSLSAAVSLASAVASAIGPATQAATAEVSITGAAAQEIAPGEVSAEASVSYSGAIAQSLESASQSLSATVAESESITGYVAQQIASSSQALDATASYAATVASQVASFWQLVTAVRSSEASIAQGIQAAAQLASATVTYAAVIAQTAQAATSEIDASEEFSGQVVVSIQPVTNLLTAAALLSGALAQVASAARNSASATVSLSGAITQTLTAPSQTISALTGWPFDVVVDVLGSYLASNQCAGVAALTQALTASYVRHGNLTGAAVLSAGLTGLYQRTKAL